MQNKSITSEVEKPAGDLADLVGSQKSLIASQENFIRMQQHLMAQHLLSAGKGGIAVDQLVSGTEIHHQGEDALHVLETGKLQDGQGGFQEEIDEGRSEEDRAPRSFLSRYGFQAFLPLALGAIVIGILFSGPKEVTDLRKQLGALRQKEIDEQTEHKRETSRLSEQIRQLQDDLVANENALAQNQAALLQTEQALKTAQGRDTISEDNGNVAPATAPTAMPTSKPTPLSDEQLQASLENLTKIRQAIAQNNGDYLVAANSLAINERALAVAQSQLEARKGVPVTNADELAKMPADNYLPDEAKEMIKAQAISSQEHPVSPTSIAEANKQILQLNNELLVAQRRLRKVQKDLGVTQDKLWNAITALNAK
jgi:hypothetical protein